MANEVTRADDDSGIDDYYKCAALATMNIKDNQWRSYKQISYNMTC